MKLINKIIHYLKQNPGLILKKKRVLANCHSSSVYTARVTKTVVVWAVHIMKAPTYNMEMSGFFLENQTELRQIN